MESIHQIHFDRKFYQCKKSGYWISTDYGKNNPRVRAHQWVWINYHGPIPKGYHVHHRNEDKSDNRIENLELIHKSRHASYHMSSAERKLKSALVCDKIRPLTKVWHASEEGKTWHKLHALKNKFGKWEDKEYQCKHCANKFTSSKKFGNGTLFCSNACKSAWRRKRGVDDISLCCGICLKEFKKNKYSNAVTCSRTCSALMRWSRNLSR